MKLQEFRFRPGPIFTQLLLADEINRSPAKTHAALLEICEPEIAELEKLLGRDFSAWRRPADPASDP